MIIGRASNGQVGKMALWLPILKGSGTPNYRLISKKLREAIFKKGGGNYKVERTKAKIHHPEPDRVVLVGLRGSSKRKYTGESSIKNNCAANFGGGFCLCSSI